MKAYLMYRGRDFDMAQEPPPYADALVQDLELTTLFAAMARDDKGLTDVVRKAVLASSTDMGTILYRQEILRDCLSREDVIREIYVLAVETIEFERKNYLGSFLRSPGLVLHRSVQVLEMFVGQLQRLRAIADRQISMFRSEGFRTLFGMLQRELDDAYFAKIQHHLRQLKFNHGVLLSAQLGVGNRGIEYVLRKENPPEGNWMTRLLAAGPPSYTFTLHPRDEGGFRALGELRDRGINIVGNAMAQSTEHILSFFQMLRTELAFYIGCLNLQGQLAAHGAPVCFPQPVASSERKHTATGLYDVCLALTMQRDVVGNELAGDGKELVIITGANQGGKSTFLRAIGLAKVMMQCGMFVPASAFRANLCERVLTHYKREEDTEMKSGKFDEELARMSGIVDQIVPNSLMLFNESFASTNEREGSEIARQIVTALLERRVKVVFVTHQYEFAHSFQGGSFPGVLFLRARRQADGSRPFKLTEGEPLRTSYGEDLYRDIFLAEAHAAGRDRAPLTSG
jgi:hypothetical protein